MKTWRRNSLGGVAAASAAALLLGAGGGAAAQARATGGGDTSSPPVQVWITTADGQQKLAGQAPVAFSPSPPANLAVTVDPTRTFQTMTGFGGSITDSSAAVLYTLSPAARQAAMHLLFDPVTGDGLDFLRQPIGASDFTTTPAYTYDDRPPGQTDYSQSHFSIAHDEAQILPLLREAEKINPRLTIMATPWSPPAWMKTGGSLIGGRLIDSPAIYRSYALYLLKFVQAYQAQGVRIDAITVQNEPQNRTPGTYPGTDLRPSRKRRSSSNWARCCAPPGSAPRSSPTTTTGRSTLTTSPRPRRTRPPTPTTMRRKCSHPRRHGGSRVSPTTAITATPAP